MDNKDYIINIRVSKETYNKLKQKAKENSESLSGLVRKTLDDSWEIFSDLKNDFFGKDGKKEIAYFQKVIVASNTLCDNCGSRIPKGTEAFLGETKSGEKKLFCVSCFTAN